MGVSPDVFNEALFMEIFWRIMLIVLFVVAAVSVVMYVFQAIGLQKIARRRGIKHPWLAWIPFGDYWILGSISDRLHQTLRGKDPNRRKLLIGLFAVTFVVGTVQSLVSWRDIWALYQDPVALMEMTPMEMEEWQLAVAAKTSLGPLMDLVVSAVEIAGLVFYYICLHDLYASCRPDLKVVFLVLSIIFGVTVPFFVFACRNADMGMPPERPQLPYSGGDPWNRETPPDGWDMTNP